MERTPLGESLLRWTRLAVGARRSVFRFSAGGRMFAKKGVGTKGTFCARGGLVFFRGCIQFDWPMRDQTDRVTRVRSIA